MRKLRVIGPAVLIAWLMVLMAGCGPGASSTETPSSPSEVGPGPALKLAFTTQPAGAVAGSVFDTQPVVAVEDAEGNIVTGYRGLVVLTITEGTGASRAHLFGGTTVGLVDGVVEFRGLNIDKVGSGYTLTATCGDLVPATSQPFTISPGAPAKLAFTIQPSGGVAGSPLTPPPEVTVQDIYGNKVNSYEGSVTLSAALTYEEKSYRSSLSGTNTVRVVSGVARFTDISIEKTYPQYELTASSEGLAKSTSRTFKISPAAPAKLEFTIQPSGAEAGTPFETQPKVAVVDTYGNVVTSSRASITLSITSDSGAAGAILSGNTTLVAEGGLGGLAVFEDLSIDLAGSGYTLTATSGGLTSAVSEAFDVSAP